MATFRDAIFDQLEWYRQSGEFCDLAVTVGRDSFSVHRNIVAAASPFIKEALKQDEDTVKLDADSCTALGFGCFLDFIYRDELTFDPITVIQTLQTADVLQCKALVERCIKFMKESIGDNTCVAYVQACTSPHTADVREAALKFCSTNILDINNRQNISQELLCEVLQHPESRQTYTEMELLYMCMKWCDANPQVEPMAVIKHIDLDKLHADHLNIILEQDFTKKHAALEKQIVRAFQRRHCTPSSSTVLVIKNSHGPAVHQFDLTRRKYTEEGIVSTDGIYIHSTVQPVTVGSTLYLLGGSEPSKEVFSYEFTKKLWKKLANMRRAGYGRAVATLGHFIYTVGGFGNDTRWADVDRYNILENIWEALGDSPVATYGRSACVVNGKMFVSGGASGDAGKLIHLYEVEEDTWSLSGHFIAARKGHFTCAFNSKMYVISGVKDGSSFLEVFDPKVSQCTAIKMEHSYIQLCYRRAAQVYPGIVYIYDHKQPEKFIMLDLKNNSICVIEGGIATRTIAIASISL